MSLGQVVLECDRERLKVTAGSFCSLAVRVPGSGLSALDYRRDGHHAHSGGPRHGHPADSGASQRFLFMLQGQMESRTTLTGLCVYR